MKGKSLTLLVASLAVFMVILDTTVVNVAIHGIRESLGANLAGLQWVIDGYALSFACILLTAGAIADRIGPRPAVGVGMGLFGITSLLCGLAPNLNVLILARVAQGFGAALLIPSSLALISRTFTAPAERAKALSVWGGIGGGSAMTAGPIVGGLLTGYLGWRSVFLINVPVAIFAIVLLQLVPKEAKSVSKRGLDLPGQAAAMIALASTTYLFIEGPNLGWLSAGSVASAVVAIVSILSFLRIESRGTDPMLPLEFFKIREFSVSTGIGFALNFAFYGQMFLLNVILQERLGLSPQATGLRFLPQAIGGVAFAYIAGQTATRFPASRALGVGTALSATGMFLLQSVGLHGNVWVDSLCMALIGISIGTPASLMAIMLGSVPTERAGLAGGAINAARQAGGLLGVAVLGATVGHAGTSGVSIALTGAAGILAAAAIASRTLLGTQQITATEPEFVEALAEAMA